MVRAYLIDYPPPSSSIKVWEEFLVEMKKLPQDDENVKDCIEFAEEIIMKKKAQK